MVKREHARAFHDLVDTVIDTAAETLAHAQNTLDTLDVHVAKAMTLLDHATQFVDGLVDDEPVEKDSPNALIDELSKRIGFDVKRLRTLDINALLDLYNTSKKVHEGWADVTDDVEANAPVESEHYKRNYIINNTSLTGEDISDLDAEQIDWMFDSLKRREQAHPENKGL